MNWPGAGLSDEGEGRQILTEAVEALRGSGYERLWQRFTERRIGLLRRRSRVIERPEELHEVRAPSGRLYQIELEAACEEEDLHIFVTVLEERRADLTINEDFIVSPGRDASGR